MQYILHDICTYILMQFILQIHFHLLRSLLLYYFYMVDMFLPNTIRLYIHIEKYSSRGNSDCPVLYEKSSSNQ